MDLRCKKTICKHNKNFACTASKVHIARNTDCLTYDRDFAKTPEKLQDAIRDMFEIAPEVSEYSHNDKLCVDCRAHCLFNKMGKCNANGITVLENSKNGCCGTFIEE